MNECEVRDSQIRGLLWFYSDVEADTLDVGTVSATFCVPQPVVREVFHELVDRGYARAIGEDTFRLTERGENATMTRGGARVTA